VPPPVTIVLPTTDPGPRIAPTLEAIAAQDYPGAFETVVVVDGADPASTPPGSGSVRFLRQERAGPAAARNRGAADATGEILVFVDDDCRPERRWLRELVAVSERHPGAAVAGRVVDASGSIFGVATQLLIDTLAEQYAETRPGREFATTNNLAVPRQAFADVGGFDERFRLAAAEDREFAERWRRSGRTFVGAPAAVVHHAHRMSLVRFLGKHARYGRGAHGLRSGGVERDGERFERPRFYLDLVAAPLRRPELPRRRALLLAGLLALSQAATAAGYAAEAVARRAAG